jgi:hypothetical protein
MPEPNADGRQGPQLSPQALRLADLVRTLLALGTLPMTVDTRQADIDAGAPSTTGASRAHALIGFSSGRRSIADRPRLRLAGWPDYGAGICRVGHNSLSPADRSVLWRWPEVHAVRRCHQ